jgi:hypothetical protein
MVVDAYHEARRFWNEFHEDGQARLGNPNIVHANDLLCPTGLVHAKLITPSMRSTFWSIRSGPSKPTIGSVLSLCSRQHFFPHFPENRMEVVNLGSRFVLYE